MELDIFTIVFIFCFFFLNLGIVYYDLKYQKILNKGLIILGIFALIVNGYHVLYFSLEFQDIIKNGMLSFILSFGLYIGKIWGAGDAKYLLMLSLFIPYIGIIPFIGNITLLTLMYLCCHIIWFYTIKIFKNKILKKFLISKTQDYIAQLSLKNIYSLREKIILFMIGFIFLRYIRDIWSYFLQQNSTSFYETTGINYSQYTLILVSLFILIIVGCIKILLYIGNNIFEKRKYNTSKLKKNGFYAIILIFIIFIGIELLINFNTTVNNLVTILSIYLVIFLIIKFGKSLIHTSFEIGEKYLVSIESLTPGMILDTKEMKNLLGRKKELLTHTGYNIETKLLNQEDIKKLKQTVLLSNEDIIKKNKNEDIIEYVIVLKTIPYGIFIFVGYIITYIFEDTIIRMLLEAILPF